MRKKHANGSNVIKNYSSSYWFLLFSGLASFIFLFRGFLFNEYGGLRYNYAEEVVPLLILILLLFSMVISMLIFNKIALRRDGNIILNIHYTESNVSNIENLKYLIISCIKLEEFRFLLYSNLFILFLGGFLSDLLRRSTDEAMVGVYIMFFLLAMSITVSILIFIGMLIATKGIKKNLFAKSLILLSTMAISILTFYAFFRILWIDLYF
jgi:hypothetical protein